MSAIRTKPQLRKAEAPVEKPPAPAAEDKHSVLMQSIRQGIQLKKASARPLPEKKVEQKGPMSVAEILARTIRPAMVDSDSDSDSDDDDWA